MSERQRATTATTLLGRDDKPIAIQVRGFALEVQSGADAGRRVCGEKRHLLIGTHPSSDLVLRDPHVSRLHARLDVDEQDYVLRDLGSTNGTRVGGVRVREACLHDDCVIEVGATQLRFRLSETGFEIPLAPEECFEGLVGRSVAMRELFALCARVAPTDAAVLLEGETGTGKELVARALHARSRRQPRPFVVFDCGAVPPTLIESELFGHEKGAFTGAVQSRAGVFERAHGGTVFLDELGELAIELQPKLLRVLETGTFLPVGGDKEKKVDVRVVSATHRDLARMLTDGSFRADLYYRLAVIRLAVPPLRERREDIPLLCAHFARKRMGPSLPSVALEAAFDELRHYDWPGNVRELSNVVERAIVLCDPREIKKSTLDAASELSRSVEKSIHNRVSLRAAKTEREREYLVDLLRMTEGDLDLASQIAEVHRKSLERLLRKHQLCSKA
jgi:DNA-binding NtrC family response regulator